MHMKQLTLQNFKSFASTATIMLSSATNIVVGRNGTGKSSLVSGIHFLTCFSRYTPEERAGFIHEGNVLSESPAVVEIVFDNADQRFPGNREFVVRRAAGPRRDEYTLDGRPIMRDELMGLFQSAGFSLDNPYFIVMQGRIAEIAVLSDEGRYELIKGVAGASNYERDRGASLEMLEETKQIEVKIASLLRRIEEKLKGLERERKELSVTEALEKEKKRLEYAYAEREISELNRSIAEIEDRMLSPTESEDEENAQENEMDLKMVRMEIERLYDRKKRLSLDPAYRGRERELQQEIRRRQDRMAQMRSRREERMGSLHKLREEEKECFVRLNYLKYLVAFLSTFNARSRGRASGEEIASARSILGAKKEELMRERERIERGTESTPRADEGLESLVERRKALWREEKKIDATTRSMREMLLSQENRLLLAGNTALSAYQQIKNERGVLGCMYEILTIPEELVDALEAVAGNSLFHVIVEGEDVASRLISEMEKRGISTRLTFIPLSRVEAEEEEAIRDPTVISLRSQLRCEPRFRPVLRLVTRNAYLCSDIRTAIHASRKYGINVVTLEGDMVNRKGPISGGYEKRSSFLRDYRKIHRTVTEHMERLQRVKEEIGELDQRIAEIKLCEDEARPDGSRYVESLGATVLFLEEKIRIMEAGEGKAWNMKKLRDEEENARYKEMCISNEIKKLEVEVQEMEFGIRKVMEEIGAFERRLEKANEHLESAEIDGMIAELRGRERRIKESLFNEENRELYVRPKKMDLEAEKMMARKHLLISRRGELCEKLGATDFRALDRLFGELSKEEIIGELRKINDRLRKYPPLNKKAASQWESYIEQKDGLKRRMAELGTGRERIKAFIHELDSRKEDAVSLTLSMLQANYSVFYSKLANGGTSELCPYEGGVGVRINGEAVDVNTLSGGQKTVVALALIFSIQKIDPSPFYVFDEADANLDVQTRERVCSLINELSKDGVSQFLITTFREEMLNCGTKFYGVAFSDKHSSIKEISKGAARDFLSETAPER
jgi:structural maintenance of chromosome 3 (chondroitin sulfate proteoglycan 6)